jgi:glycosyltransferase involved in cell wall biosynthesis
MLPDHELVPLLNTADVCLAPDPKNPMNDQSTMLKVMEYMAVGKPVVQYDLTEGRATAGEASLYARPSDPAHFAALVHELLEDDAKRARMGAWGRNRVEAELQWERQIPKYLGVLESVGEGRLP